MTDPLHQAQALSDPTRHAIYRSIAAAPRPRRVAELAAEFDLHPNAVRQHVAKLEAAGLVDRGRAPSAGRGRRADTFTATPTAEDAYQHLALLLAEVVRTGDRPDEVGRRRGRDLAAARDRQRPAEVVLAEEMTRLGFDPEVTDDDEGVQILLHRCPFAEVAAREAATVCALHEGIAAGIGEVLGGIDVAGIEARDPRSGPCTLRIRRR